MSIVPTQDPAIVAKLSRAMSECVPELAARSTVGIVASTNQYVRQIGTGTLLAVADHRFVVTAAHVVHQDALAGATFGISGTVDGQFVAAVGSWILSGDSADRPSDEHDIGIYEFSPEQAARFADDVFVRVADVDFPADLSHGFFVVCGFPAVWSTSLKPSDMTLSTKMLQLGTFALQGSVTGLTKYNPQRHFLLEASLDILLDRSARNTSFRTRGGYPAQMPRDLAGVSGCSVWMLGDLRQPIEQWSKKTARLVGIETSVYERRRAIKVTRWNGVTTLLHAAFPRTRRVLEMYAIPHGAP